MPSSPHASASGLLRCPKTPERVSGFVRNGCPESTGIRTRILGSIGPFGFAELWWPIAYELSSEPAWAPGPLRLPPSIAYRLGNRNWIILVRCHRNVGRRDPRPKVLHEPLRIPRGCWRKHNLESLYDRGVQQRAIV